MGSWDIYASALVTAPSGDPQYFFTTSCVPGMSYNFGAYDNPEVTALIEQLSREFDPAKRGKMAVTLQQMILDDNAYVFCSFLQMNMISRKTSKTTPPTPAITIRSRLTSISRKRTPSTNASLCGTIRAVLTQREVFLWPQNSRTI